MLHQVEIDVMQNNELSLAVDLAIVYKLPALVVHQSLISEALLLRLARCGHFKVIAPVDWPNGINYGPCKMRGILANAMHADGFEILLTPGRSKDEIRNEAGSIAEFIRHNVSATAEIRFVLHMYSMEAESYDMYDTLLDIRRPAMVRTGLNTKLPANKANVRIHRDILTKLKNIAALPIKISGNIIPRTIQGCAIADRLATSLFQFENIIKANNVTV